MFIYTSVNPPFLLRPQASGISENDWGVLSRFWYPVAYEHEVEDTPVAAKLLDVDLVIFRAGDEIGVALDRCPHRHIKLSAGTIVEDGIKCMYHGLVFNTGGQCTFVPSIDPGTKLPATWRLTSFPMQRRYGLVWTCLAQETDRDVPALLRDEDQDASRLLFVKARIWPVSAARQMENFIDLAHLPHIHSESLGGDPDNIIKPGNIEHTEDGIIQTAGYTEVPFGSTPRDVVFTYRVVLPFAIDFIVNDPTGGDQRTCNIPSPRSADECKVFQFSIDTRDMDDARRSLLNGWDIINQEDIGVLRHLAVPDLPLDARHEIHLPADNVSHAYRQRLREFGLGQ